MSSAFPKGIILKSQFDEGKIINLRAEFYTYQESHMEYRHELFLVVKVTVLFVSQLSKPPLFSVAPCILTRVPSPSARSFRMMFS